MYSSDMMNEFPLTSPTSLMTPNTIKTIEQSILASLDSSSNNPTIIASAATGSFLPPLPNQQQQIIVTTNSSNSGGSCWQGNQLKISNNNSMSKAISYHSYSNSNSSEDTDDNSSDNYDNIKISNKKRVQKRNVKSVKSVKKIGNGGRKPKRIIGNPEEEERRRVRRERNKLAAARCRKRRVDHTNLLLEETEELESIRRSLQDQIEKFQSEKEELEFIIEAHMPNCKQKNNPHSNNVVIKTERPDRLISPDICQPTFQSSPQQPNNNVKPAVRPTSLLVNTRSTGIPISTPSNGLNIIGFDNIDWNELPSTGLTPTVTNVTNTLVTPLVTPSTANAILLCLNQNQQQQQQQNNNKFVNL